MALNSVISSVAAQDPLVGSALSSANTASGLLSTLSGNAPSMQGLLTAVNTPSLPPNLGQASSAAVSQANPFDPNTNSGLAVANNQASQVSQLLSGLGTHIDILA